ncbi:MAG: hypothetical protein GEU79_08890 [Acidimicrobiia bacterium]|nr:hypothetical protein [Acidimicrobiia bacterium]
MLTEAVASTRGSHLVCPAWSFSGPVPGRMHVLRRSLCSHGQNAERSALRLAFASGLSPSAVTDKDFAELCQFFDDDAIVEIVDVSALSGFMNRWNATMGTELMESPRDIAERPLSDHGWHVGPHGQKDVSGGGTVAQREHRRNGESLGRS